MCYTIKNRLYKAVFVIYRERSDNMDDLKAIIATNISALRREAGLTQLELAEKLNYSDKAVSKWERGESIPDVAVLKKFADMFGVTVDYLLKLDHTEENNRQLRIGRRKKRNRAIIMGIGIVLVWFIATFLFFVLESATELSVAPLSLAFIYSVPASMVVWLIFNSIWFNRRLNFLIISFLLWTFLASLFITLVNFGFNLWFVFIIGVPAQIIILLWSGIKTRSKKRK